MLLGIRRSQNRIGDLIYMACQDIMIPNELQRKKVVVQSYIILASDGPNVLEIPKLALPGLLGIDYMAKQESADVRSAMSAKLTNCTSYVRLAYGHPDACR
jgi:hypothetical protein